MREIKVNSKWIVVASLLLISGGIALAQVSGIIGIRPEPLPAIITPTVSLSDNAQQGIADDAAKQGLTSDEIITNVVNQRYDGAVQYKSYVYWQRAYMDAHIALLRTKDPVLLQQAVECITPILPTTTTSTTTTTIPEPISPTTSTLELLPEGPSA